MPKLFLPKHARTHLPGGSDPLEITITTDPGTAEASRWMLIGSNEIAVPTDDETPGIPDTWYTNDDPDSPVALRRILEAEDPSFLGGQIELIASGLYHVTIYAQWEGGVYDGVVFGKHFFNSNTFTPQIHAQGRSTILDSYTALGFHVLNVPGDNPTVRASFLHNNGSDRDVAWRMLVSKIDAASGSFSGFYFED